MKRLNRHAFVLILLVFLCIGMLAPTDVSAASAPKLNKKKLTLKQGEKKKLKVKRTGGKKVKWKSKKKRIASVTKKGVVKAKNAGKTTITAKVGKKTLKCKVTVLAKTTGTKPPKQTPKPSTATQTPSVTASPIPGQTQTPAPTQKPAVTASPIPGQTATPSPVPTQNPSTTASPTPEPTPVPSAAPLYDADTVSTDDYGKYYSTHAVHSGQATYFDGGYVNGCCNLDAIAGDFDVVAMNEYDYNKGLLAGAFIEITGPKGTICALVTDLLPADESVRGNLDLNENTFKKIAEPIAGRVNVTWRVIALDKYKTISYRMKDSSNPYWAQIQVVGHKYPITKLEYLSNGTYVELPRENYNFFTAADGLGSGAVTFRVTDIFGHQLIDSGISLSPGDVVPGKANFPE